MTVHHLITFTSPADLYKPFYLEVFDTALTALDKRFNSDTLSLVANAEALITIGIHAEQIIRFADDDKLDNSTLNQITASYGHDLNAKRLQLHIIMLHDIIQQRQLCISCL